MERKRYTEGRERKGENRREEKRRERVCVCVGQIDRQTER